MFYILMFQHPCVIKKSEHSLSPHLLAHLLRLGNDGLPGGLGEGGEEEVAGGTRELPEINMLGYEWLAFLVFGLAAALILAFVVWVTAEICQSSCTHGEAEN